MGTIEEVLGGSHSGFNHITYNDGGPGGHGPTAFKPSCTNFLVKLYKMIDNKVNDSIISWGPSCNTFVISDERRFISEILPCYFKIDHFDNFTYQLDNYGFKKRKGGCLEFEHEYFKEGNQHLLKHIKTRNQPLMATNNMPKPTLSVAINELAALFAKVRHKHKQIRNKTYRFKDSIKKSLSEVKSIIEDYSHKLIITFSEGRNRKLVSFNSGTDFVDVEKDIVLMYDQYNGSVARIDGFMTLSDLTDKMAKEFNDNDRGGGVDGRICVPPFLQKLYEMVEKEDLDSLISWNLPSRDSFIIRDINQFAAQVLPMYFSHKNFSSFNTQLHIYGFTKITWEHHEYANEWFQGGRSDLLVNIKKREKNPLLARSTMMFSTIEVEMIKDQLKTIELEQENKILCFSNYEEEMKSRVHEFMEIVVNTVNIVNKMILISNENLETFKKPKMDIEDNVIDDLIGNIKGQALDVDGLGGNHMASIDNNSAEAEPYLVDLEIDLEAVGIDMEMEETAWIAEREMEQYFRPWKQE